MTNEAPKDAWQRILADDELANARRKLSIHEIRLMLRHGVEAFVDLADAKPYDPQGAGSGDAPPVVLRQRFSRQLGRRRMSV